MSGRRSTISHTPRREPKPDSERAIQREVVTYLRRKGWFVQITSAAMKNSPGMRGVPDLICHLPDVMMKTTLTLYVECKRKGGTLRPSQEKWLEKAKPYFSSNMGFLIAEAPKMLEFYFFLHEVYLRNKMSPPRFS